MFFAETIDYSLIIASQMTGCKPPFYAGFEASMICSSPMSSAIPAGVRFTSAFLLYIGISIFLDLLYFLLHALRCVCLDLFRLV